MVLSVFNYFYNYMKKNKIFKERPCLPDLVYNSSEISKFINVMMLSGKKTISRKIIYNTFNYIFKKLKKDPLRIFSIAIDNISPMMEIRKKKISNGVQTSFIEIRNLKRISLAMRLIKKSSRERTERFMYLRLGNEIIEGFEKRSKIYKKRFDLKKISNLNKTYKTN